MGTDVNVKKSLEFTALERQYLLASVVLYEASVIRASKAEKDPEVVRIRQRTAGELAVLKARFSGG